MAITPEDAARLREEDEAVTATTLVAQAIINAATIAAQQTVAAARQRHRAAQRTILRRLRIDDDAQIIAIDGHGSELTVVLEFPATHKVE